MKLVSVKDYSGKVYEFEAKDNSIRLLKVLNNVFGGVKIVGYYMVGDIVIPTTWTQEGKHTYNRKNTALKDLTPYDKFKDLKKAHSEGAKIEVSDGLTSGWVGVHLPPRWDVRNNYQIKGNISIESWNAHKNTIMSFWNGGRIEALNSNGGWHETTGSELWSHDVQFRVMETETVMSIKELEEKFGIKNLKIKGE